MHNTKITPYSLVDKEPRSSMRTMAMEPSSLLTILFLLYVFIPASAANDTYTLSSCFLSANLNFTLHSSQISDAYSKLLNSSIHNLRFSDSSLPKPVAIVLPHTQYHLKSAILCCRRTSIVIRLRSSGHSYEGLSYVGDPGKPFAVIDLMKLNRVTVNATSSTAWIESGATIGEIYHAIAEASSTLAFPAGSCSTVGSGGHIGGGGFGLLARRYGLAADNVIDAVLIDPDGRSLDRNSMGEDVFWAIRGGGGGSWGAVYAWQVQLVQVPKILTTCSIPRHGTVSQVAELVYKWQYVAPSLPDEFYLSVSVGGDGGGNVLATFLVQFLGARNSTVSILSRRFAELEVAESECTEMSWIDSVVRFAGLRSVPELKDRVVQPGTYFKGKSDYVRIPINVSSLVRALDWLLRDPAGYVILDPYGGAMSRIRSDQLPFPHRSGNIYDIQYNIGWTMEDDGKREQYMEWIRGFYRYMEPLVSRSPRAAYVNYLDLDIGRCGSTVEEARVYGEKYFLVNFDRLVQAKTIIDPDNVFSNKQSIPPLPKRGR